MGDNKISEAAALAASLRQIADAQYTRRQRFNGRLPADVQEVLRMAADHLQGEAVPVANGLRLTLCRDAHPPMKDHTTFYGGRWSSELCVVVDSLGQVVTTRYTLSDFDKGRMDATGSVPNFPWRPAGCSNAVAWVLLSDLIGHIENLTKTHPQPAELSEVSGGSGELNEVLDGCARAKDLAERLIAAGPKAAHVSASETHEISEFILSVVDLLPALAATGKQQGLEPQFHHVKQVAKHFNMAVTPEDMAKAIAAAPDHLFSRDAAHKAFAGTGKQQVGEVQVDARLNLQRYSPDPENTEYGWMQGMKEDTAMGEWVHIEDVRAIASRQPAGAQGVDVEDVLHKAVDLARGGSSAIAVVGWITSELIDGRDAGTGVE